MLGRQAALFECSPHVFHGITLLRARTISTSARDLKAAAFLGSTRKAGGQPLPLAIFWISQALRVCVHSSPWIIGSISVIWSSFLWLSESSELNWQLPFNNLVAVLWLLHLCVNFSVESRLRECCRPGSLRKQTLRWRSV